jgi:hypothetical protein
MVSSIDAAKGRQVSRRQERRPLKARRLVIMNLERRLRTALSPVE